MIQGHFYFMLELAMGITFGIMSIAIICYCTQIKLIFPYWLFYLSRFSRHAETSFLIRSEFMDCQAWPVNHVETNLEPQAFKITHIGYFLF